jgi:hypothetical protein
VFGLRNQADPYEKLRTVQEGKVEQEDLCAIIHEFGNAGFEDSEKEVARFLTHPDPDLRSITVTLLALHWVKEAYREVFEQMLFDDQIQAPQVLLPWIFLFRLVRRR